MNHCQNEIEVLPHPLLRASHKDKPISLSPLGLRILCSLCLEQPTPLSHSLPSSVTFLSFTPLVLSFRVTAKVTPPPHALPDCQAGWSRSS